MIDNSDEFTFFWGGPFSQWQRCAFNVGNLDFTTAEQFMMHQKAVLFGDSESAKSILATHDPRKQKALGQKVSNFSNSTWDENKADIAKTGNLAKFGQNKGLRRKLFQTIPTDLVEASPLDHIWGIGLSAEKANHIPESDWPGLNLLGKILTTVRNELVELYPEEATARSLEQNGDI